MIKILVLFTLSVFQYAYGGGDSNPESWVMLCEQTLKPSLSFRLNANPVHHVCPLITNIWAYQCIKIVNDDGLSNSDYHGKFVVCSHVKSDLENFCLQLKALQAGTMTLKDVISCIDAARPI